MKKILITCVCLVLAGAFTFAISWGVINFNKVKEGMSGTGVYTEQDLNKAYEDGYGNGIKDKAEYLILIDEYRNTITTLNDTISQLNFQVNTLNNTNKDYEIYAESLKTQKATLEKEVTLLEQDAENNQDTIFRLNNQIISLNKQISDLSNLTQTASSQITALNNRVNELQSSVNYYESFIAQMENGEQVVATYEVDGSVWKIEIVNKGSEITLPVLTDSDAFIFNGWIVSGNDLVGDTYTIDTNTKFVADLIRKYSVKFMSDDQIYDTQYIVENGYITVPSAPQKNGYDFLGWSVNGIDIINNIDSLKTTANITYHAVYVKVHTVTFMNDSQVVAIQHVRNGEYPNPNDVAIETDGVFISWQSDGVNINVQNYQIYADTIFTANISYDDWIRLETDGTTYINPSSIWINGDDCYHSDGFTTHKLNKSTKTWERITWNVDIEGQHIWTDGVDSYYSYGSDQYKLNKSTNTWDAVTWFGLNSFYGNYVWTDGVNCYYSNGSDQYKLNKSTNTWDAITWNSLNYFYGYNVWTDGVDSYYSYGSGQYKLNKSTNIWESITWQGGINPIGEYIWVYNGTVYLRADYVLNTTTNTCTSIVWEGLPDTENIKLPWTDGENYYVCINGENRHFILNTVTNKWEEIIFNSPTSMSAIGYTNVWTDGVDCYSSNGYGHFKLKKSAKTWERITWNVDVDSRYIWTDGVDSYYSYRSNQYKLNKSTNTWETITWTGLDSVDSKYIWTDETNCYYSNGSNQYKLNKSTNTWEKIKWKNGITNYTFTFTADDIWTDGVNYYYYKSFKLNTLTYTAESITWNGLDNLVDTFRANKVWTDGVNMYYSNESDQYKLNKSTNTWESITWTGTGELPYGDRIWTDGDNCYYKYKDGIYFFAKKVA